ncbi:MAG: helix-turn-helix domain-containing protein [Rubrivivax sp.]|jgi:IS30 family transposase
MGYHHLATRERYLIVAHKSMGLSLRQVGKALCRDAATISRKVKRNADTSDARYRVEKADSYARGGVRNSVCEAVY